MALLTPHNGQLLLYVTHYIEQWQSSLNFPITAFLTWCVLTLEQVFMLIGTAMHDDVNGNKDG